MVTLPQRSRKSDLGDFAHAVERADICDLKTNISSAISNLTSLDCGAKHGLLLREIAHCVILWSAILLYSFILYYSIFYRITAYYGALYYTILYFRRAALYCVI